MAADLRQASELIRAGSAQLVFCPQPGPQMAALSCPIPDLLFGGARGGGKTFYMLGDFLKHQSTYGAAARGMMMRRTYAELDEVQAQAVEMYRKVGAYFRDGKATWQFPNGAQLKLRYLRRDADAANYQGHQYTWLGIDEAGNFPNPAPIDKLRATLRSKHGVPTFLRMSANPGGPGHRWLKLEYIDPAPPMTPHLDPRTGLPRIFIPSRLSDNKILTDNDPTYASRLRASGPAWLVNAWLNGDWNAAPEGGVIRASWFRRWEDKPQPPDRYLLVHSWDTAYKSGEHNDPSCCTVWAVTPTGYFLLESFVKRMDYPELKKQMIDMADRDSPNLILIEDKASGQSLIQELRGHTQLPIKAIEPIGDKVTRALAVSDMIEAGLVFLPERATWLLEYELELSVFPTKEAHDDQVDSTTQFLSWARVHAVRRAEVIGSGNLRIGLQPGYISTNEQNFASLSAGVDLRGFE